MLQSMDEIFRSILLLPAKNALLIALGVVLLAAFLVLFGPGIIKRVIGNSFIRWAEVAGTLVSLVMLICWILYSSKITEVEIGLVFSVIVMALIGSLAIVIWELNKKSDK